MNFGDGADTTDQSIIWNVDDSRGKDSSGEFVSAPSVNLVEDTLKAEILDLLQEGGIEFLATAFPETLFVEDVQQEPLPQEEDTEG